MVLCPPISLTKTFKSASKACQTSPAHHNFQLLPWEKHVTCITDTEIISFLTLLVLILIISYGTNFFTNQDFIFGHDSL